jgi:beta-glucosidase
VDVEQRVNALLAKMTLQEKLGQMSQRGFPDPKKDDWKGEVRAGRWGSYYSGAKPEERSAIEAIALKESRLGIPLIFGADLLHGFHTTFPIPLGESASWDPELVRAAARFSAVEGSREGIHWTFAPMLDIGRDPRWGRIAETLGEDPTLSSAMAAAITRGFQGDSLSDPTSIAACGKHYVGYGACEGGRDYNTTWIPDALLRNVYLTPFQAACKAGIASYMSAFNDLNGVPTSANEFTLRRILRDEWKFDGMVVCDYAAVGQLVAHGYAADQSDAALKAVRAGVDMEMVSKCYYENGASLVNSGKLDPKLIDESVRNILRVKFRLGLFDGKAAAQYAAGTSSPEALETARKLAEESFVLLKNDGEALPISKTIGKVAVIGPLADESVDQLGTWKADSHGPSITPLVAFRQRLGESRVAYAKGLKDCQDHSTDGFGAASDAARSADVVILFIGENEWMNGEAASRAYLDLPGAQEALVDRIAEAGKPMIAVIMAGRPLTFHKLAQKMAAVLYAWDPGSEGGPAIVDTLFGDSVPSGKLTVTFPRTVGQVPIYYDHDNTGRPAAETGPYAKEHYTSKYIDERFTPEYPFGFGLSYTTFKYAAPHVSSSTMDVGGEIGVNAEVTNSGSVDADEVVQLYTRQLVGTLTRPVRELRGFQRVHLKAGESKDVTFTLKSDALKYYDAAGQQLLEPGKSDVWISPDSASGEMAEFTLVDSRGGSGRGN